MKTLNRRHGDLNMIYKKIPIKWLNVIGKQSFTLQTWDTTGHSHTITAWKDSTLTVYELPNGNMVLQVKGEANITHPEHKKLNFPTGAWEVMRELEYDYFGKATRKVID